MAFGQGATVHHSHRTGRGLLHVRQRRYPVRTPGGRGRRLGVGQGGQAVHPPGDRARQPAGDHLPGPAHRVRRRGQQPAAAPPTGFPGLGTFPGGVAGKTGTADSELGKEPTAWFVGFGPTADPQYVVVCVIDQAGFGATAAAPVVGQIFNYLAAHPVTAPGIPPGPGLVQQTGPIALPAHLDPRCCSAATGASRRLHPDHRRPDRRVSRAGEPGAASSGTPTAWPPRMAVLGCWGRWSPSGHVLNPFWPRSPSRLATSVENWVHSGWSTMPRGVVAAHLSRHLRDRPSQPGVADPLRDPQRTSPTPWRSGPTHRGWTWKRPCDRPVCPCSPSRTTCRPGASTYSPSISPPSWSTPTSSI